MLVDIVVYVVAVVVGVGVVVCVDNDNWLNVVNMLYVNVAVVADDVGSC